MNLGDDPLATPIGRIVADAVGERARYDSRTGLNQYGASPLPRPEALPFSSSTASSLTPGAYRHLRKLHGELSCATELRGPGSAMATAITQLKQQLLGLCGVEGKDGTEVVLTHSGTEAELFILQLLRMHRDRPAAVILISPEETGSGVVDAVLGRHPDAETPFGGAVRKGSPIDGCLRLESELTIVAVRDPKGKVRSPESIDAEITEHVARLVAAGKHCILHVLDCSKTGLIAPTQRAALSLKAEFAPHLDVVVDACQMRIATERLVRYLDAGCPVLITGSKFYSAPAFCGAVLVPLPLSQEFGHLPPLPVGFAAYTSRAYWPHNWHRLRESLPHRAAQGLVYRWQAALFEMERFAAIPAAIRARIVGELAHLVAESLGRASRIVPLADGRARGRTAGLPRSWDRTPTLFPFLALAPGSSGVPLPMSPDGTRQVHRLLNVDLCRRAGARVSAEDRRVLATPCHLGQPVILPRDGESPLAVLRLAIGAPMVSNIAEAATKTGSFTTAFADAARQIELVVRKVDGIVRRIGELSEPERSASLTGEALQHTPSAIAIRGWSKGRERFGA
jgi:hypothetical protein